MPRLYLPIITLWSIFMVLVLLSTDAEAEPRYDVSAIVGGFSHHYTDNEGKGFNEKHDSLGIQVRRIVDDGKADMKWATGASLMRNTNSYAKTSYVLRGSATGCSLGDHEFCAGGGLALATGYKEALGHNPMPIPGFLISYTYRGFGFEINHVPQAFTAIQGLIRF